MQCTHIYQCLRFRYVVSGFGWLHFQNSLLFFVFPALVLIHFCMLFPYAVCTRIWVSLYSQWNVSLAAPSSFIACSRLLRMCQHEKAEIERGKNHPKSLNLILEPERIKNAKLVGCSTAHSLSHISGNKPILSSTHVRMMLRVLSFRQDITRATPRKYSTWWNWFSLLQWRERVREARQIRYKSVAEKMERKQPQQPVPREQSLNKNEINGYMVLDTHKHL